MRLTKRKQLIDLTTTRRH